MMPMELPKAVPFCDVLHVDEHIKMRSPFFKTPATVGVPGCDPGPGLKAAAAPT